MKTYLHTCLGQSSIVIKYTCNKEALLYTKYYNIHNKYSNCKFVRNLSSNTLKIFISKQIKWYRIFNLF